MSTTIPDLRRAERRRLQRLVRKSRDSAVIRRALALLQLDTGKRPTEVARVLSAARSSVYRWSNWFAEYGVDGLLSLPRGRQKTTVSDPVVQLVSGLLKKPPQAFNYLRTRWSSELLAKEVHRQLGVRIHSSTIRRLLPDIGFGWRRARPFLYKRDPHKAERLKAIENALSQRDPREAVFYADEVDVDLNPKIGFAWMERGKQTPVPTPGTNQKQYLAGALHSRTGTVTWVEGPNKRSELFVALLKQLRRRYRGFKRLVLIIDNSVIHKSRETREFLTSNPKFVFLFQPAYHPWVNRIERLWKAMHDTVTRNHQWRSMDQLMNAVRQFMSAVQPFPGAGHALVEISA